VRGDGGEGREAEGRRNEEEEVREKEEEKVVEKRGEGREDKAPWSSRVEQPQMSG
jgi:hypothetical protein